MPRFTRESAPEYDADSPDSGEFDAGSLVIEDPIVRRGYVVLERVVLLDARISPAARTLYAVLKHYARQDVECFPGMKRLQADLGVSHVSVNKWLDELVAFEYIAKRRRGLGKHNTYTILALRPDRKNLSIQIESDFQSGSKDSFSPDRKILSSTNTHIDIPHSDITHTGRLSPPGSVSNQLKLSDLEEDNATATPRLFVDDVFTHSKIAPIAPTNQHQTDTNGTANRQAKASGPPKPGTLAAMSEKAQAALVHWCGEFGRDSSKLRLNPAQVRRVETAAERHSLEILATAATWAADKALPDVLTWARAADTVARESDPNYVKGASGQRGNADAAAISDNGRRTRALRLNPQQTTIADTMAAKYPDFAGND